MKYGIDNQINGVATIVAKILLVVCPNLKFVESGCEIINNKDIPFMIVSPDGEGRYTVNSDVHVAFEIKCPTPGKHFAPQAHDKVPHYYILQCLSGMKALKCSKLLYVCFTEESSTVFELAFHSDLWHTV